ncbi:hypothetical protein [Methylovulum psychrotolerans]|uniref:hypothetical protein n=1 Tax=Methylovulum psychrotolerans TaxID=1704499 RepID=UPI0012FA569A|nr:hypothetical protein [Methylovulum psychrotolerans]
MEKEKIELYTDYLICNQGFATATGLSAMRRPPTKPRSAGSSGNRAAFSLDTFFWRSKRKYLAFGCENPIKKPSRQRLIIYF